MSKPTVSIETITPAIAEKWLREHNKNNRRIYALKVTAHVKQMKDGKFLLIPDAIAFDENGRLYNGQHRLTACVESGVSFQAIVLRHSLKEAFMVTDIGMKKMGGHALHTLGYDDVTSLSAVARVVCNIINVGGNMYEGWQSMRSIVPSDIVATVEAYPKLGEYAVIGAKLTNSHDKLCTTKTVVAVTLWYAAEHNEYDGFLEFLERTAAGVGLEDGSAELALRRRLANMRNSSTGGYAVYREMAALIIKAYTIHKHGKKITQLVWKDNEAFPSFE